MEHILYRLLPHLCPLCHSRSRSYLCSGCRGDLPRPGPCCPGCGLPTPGGHSCGDCLVTPKSYALTLCPLLYRHPVDRLVRQFKEHQPRTIGRALLPLMLENLGRIYSAARPWPQLLVPVPCHWRTRLRRGFNQAHVLADMLGAATGIPVRPLLKRQGTARQQKSLDRKTRFSNLKQAFFCSADLGGERVALIDDVITTGATAELISRCLLKAGAAEVHVWALARTPKPDN